ncbi:MAG: MFS transporter [Candidatus Methanomethylophilaceae archaeon]|nr:MFS transporter [Candidatus Methanomethylophilaceae archaeon]
MDNQAKTFRPNALTLLTILMSSMVILMGAAAVAPSLKGIGEFFGQSESMTALIIGLPALSVAVFGFLMGALADRFGKAKVLFISLAIFTAMGVLPFFLEDFIQVLVCRFLLGMGLTGISSASTALIGEYWTGVQRMKVIGYQSAAIGVGGFILETLGGTLADIGWNYPFLIYLIGAIIVIFGIASVREPALDASAMADFGEAEIPNRKGKIALCYIAVFCEMFIMFSMPTNFSYYVPSIGLGANAGLLCGVLLGTMGVAQAVFSLLYSRSANKPNEKVAYSISYVLMAIGMALLFLPEFVSGEAVLVPMLFLAEIIIGCSLGLLMPTVVASLSRLSTAKTSGKVMGGYAMALNISTFLSGMLIPLLFSALGAHTLVFASLGCFAIVVASAFLLMNASGRNAEKAHDKTLAVETIGAKKPISTDVSMYGTILVPTDGSDHSNYAVDSAINIAKKNRSSIIALFVIDAEKYSGLGYGESTGDMMREAGVQESKAALGYIAELAAENGIELTTKVVLGRPAEEIVKESENADLVVCGSLGRTNLNRALMGSVAETVARMAHCPVLICRRTAKE